MPRSAKTKPLNARHRRRRTWRNTLASLPLHAVKLVVLGVYALFAIPIFILCVGTSAAAHAAVRAAEQVTDPN